MRFALLALVLLAIGIFWSIVVAVGMALSLLKPKRMSDGRAMALLGRLSPADIGLPFEEIVFHVVDERTGGKIKIAGWWIPTPGSDGRCAIIVHGYSDAKVGGIAWAPVLRSLGMNVLAIDLRAHGESDGDYCTAGFYERHDLNQVIDQFRAARPDETKQLVLLGVSLGAAVVAAAAETRDDLAGVVLESPFNHYQIAAGRQGQRMGLPGSFVRKFAFIVAQWIARCNFSAVDPVVSIPKIPCPVMWICSGDDPFVSPEDAAELKQVMARRNNPRDMVWELADIHHVVGLMHDPDEYWRRLEQFFCQSPRPLV